MELILLMEKFTFDFNHWKQSIVDDSLQHLPDGVYKTCGSLRQWVPSRCASLKQQYLPLPLSRWGKYFAYARSNNTSQTYGLDFNANLSVLFDIPPKSAVLLCSILLQICSCKFLVTAGLTVASRCFFGSH